MHRLPQQPRFTPLLRDPRVSEALGMPDLDLHIKDESENAFGTHKDRKAWEAVRSVVTDAPNHGLCIITSGNAGRAVSSYASQFGIPVVAFVDQGMSKVLLEDIMRSGAIPVPVDLRNRYWSSEELEMKAFEILGRPCRDVSNDAAPYGYIGDEVFESILTNDRGQPHIVVVPVGGSELYVGMARRLDVHRQSHELDLRIIGVRTRNPETLADKLYCRWSPYWEEAADRSAVNSVHQLVTPDETDLLATTATLQAFLHLEPSSALPFHALSQLDISMSASVYVVNTGRFRNRRSLIAHCRGSMPTTVTDSTSAASS